VWIAKWAHKQETQRTQRSYTAKVIQYSLVTGVAFRQTRVVQTSRVLRSGCPTTKARAACCAAASSTSSRAGDTTAEDAE